MTRAKNSDGVSGNLATMQMALVGFEVEKEGIEQKIREIHSLLGGKRVKLGASRAAKAAMAQSHARREMSAAARKRIAAAQRKRWAKYRKNKKAQAT
jgi:hypothetical protein